MATQTIVRPAAASVELVVRKYVDGKDNYRKALRGHVIDPHPQRDLIIRLIEQQGVTYQN